MFFIANSAWSVLRSLGEKNYLYKSVLQTTTISADSSTPDSARKGPNTKSKRLSKARGPLANNSTTFHSQLMLTCIMRVLGFVTLHSLLHVCLGQLPLCYFWNGEEGDEVPCDPDASVSACCGQGLICDTNLYCLMTNGTRLVPTCTDVTWQSINCPILPGLFHFPLRCTSLASLLFSSLY